MNAHPYLRAYLAGIAVPTPLFLVGMTVYTVFRLTYHISVPVERFIVFPMAVVPNAWGLWNVLFIAWRGHVRLSLGMHGALLPILAPLALIFYYLVWKYVVGFLNRVLNLA